MTQYHTWEKEYQNPLLVTKGDKPQNSVLRFLKYLKKSENWKLHDLNILDLGSGTGKNANHLANLGNEVVGMEISKTALDIAQSRADDMDVKVQYLQQSIGSKYSFDDNYFDLILDVTSSNSLNEEERKIYLKETHRTLKQSGFLFVRALCKDGDKNAKNLLETNPGLEYDTYIIPELNLTERVFSEVDFKKIYSNFFIIKKLIKKSGYTKFQNQSYKRNYWLAYLCKS